MLEGRQDRRRCPLSAAHLRMVACDPWSADRYHRTSQRKVSNDMDTTKNIDARVALTFSMMALFAAAAPTRVAVSF